MATYTTHREMGVVVAALAGSLRTQEEQDLLVTELSDLGSRRPTVIDLTGLADHDAPLTAGLLARLERAPGRPCPVVLHRDLAARRTVRAHCPDLVVVPDVSAALQSHAPFARDPRVRTS